MLSLLLMHPVQAGPTAFRFLAGRKPAGQVYDVPDNFGEVFYGRARPRKGVLFAFQADGTGVIAAADRELLPQGWRRSTWIDTFLLGAEGLEFECVVYREPKGLKRTIFIEPDANPPMRMYTSDIVICGQYRRGWTGVVIEWAAPGRPKLGTHILKA